MKKVFDRYPDTHLDVDLKLLTNRRGRVAVGSLLDGTLLRDADMHFVFSEKAPEKKPELAVPRNKHVYEGRYINVNRRPDGVLYPTFRYGQLFGHNISLKDFCSRAAGELLSVEGLIEKN